MSRSLTYLSLFPNLLYLDFETDLDNLKTLCASYSNSDHLVRRVSDAISVVLVSASARGSAHTYVYDVDEFRWYFFLVDNCLTSVKESHVDPFGNFTVPRVISNVSSSVQTTL